MGHNIGRSRTVWFPKLLWVACFLALMLSAIERSFARVCTSESTFPALRGSCSHGIPGSNAWLLIRLVATSHSPLKFSTVAAAVHIDLTCTAETLVARPLACVFTAGHQITADLAAAPSSIVVRLYTSSRGRILAAVAALHRTNMSTWRTRTGMTEKLARVRALLREHTMLATGLAARVRWQARN